MIVLCVGLAALAAGLWVSPPDRQSTRLRPVAAPAMGRRPSRRCGLLVVPVAIALVGLAAWAGGGRDAAVMAAVVIAGGTAVRLIRQHRRSRIALRERAEVAHACSLLASQLRVGRVPAEALRSTAEDCPLLEPAAQVAAIGGDPVPLWRTAAQRPGRGGLIDLARAWQVSARTGSPLAPALERVAEALTEDTALRRLVAGELSAPRATGKVMAVLPLLGIGIGYAIGGQPVQFLLSSPYGWSCLVAGAALAAAGVLWIEALAQRAAEEG